MKHFISTLSGISNQSSSAVLNVAPMQMAPQQIVEPLRTDFSNLFGPTSVVPTTSAPSVGSALNASALAIAAQKAKDLLRSKNLTETFVAEKNGSSVTSNGNESSQEGELNIVEKIACFGLDPIDYLLLASAFRAALENDNSETGDASGSANDRKRKKKSRWATSSESEKTLIPGMPTILPSNLNAHQQEAYLGNYKRTENCTE